jgi:Ca-activated chloride channel family protein
MPTFLKKVKAMPSFLKLTVPLSVVIIFAQISVVTSQQANQQRPRRVTSEETQAPASNSSRDKLEEVAEGDVVRVDTQLVSVPAVVMNGTGRPVAGLRTENFRLFENGQLQKISDFATTETPFEIALLLDTSGSTRADLELVRQAAISFIDALRPGDRVAIMGFETKREGRGASAASVQVLTTLTDDRKALRKAIDALGTSNGTPYYDALERISDEVFRELPSNDLRGRRAFVALTDGVDSSSNVEFETARAKLVRAGIASYFIQVNTEEFVENALLKPCGDGGVILSMKQLQRYRRAFQPRSKPEDFIDFCEMGSFERMQISRDLYNLARRQMNDLAKASGGSTFPAATLQDARAAFARVAAEIGTQYSLGYYPTNKARDGKFRAIKVEVQGVQDKPQVRAREGYYAPKG